MKKSNTQKLIHELKHHLPFTLKATILGIALVLILNFALNLNYNKEAFEIFHPLHVIASGAASAGVFYRYKKNLPLTILIGILSAIIVGTISDIIFPYLGAELLLLNPEFHLPIIEEPIKILMAALIGSGLGISLKQTRYSHSVHVLLSVFASLFYLLAFASPGIIPLIISIIVIVLAVVIPCCISDILFPFFFLKKDIQSCSCNSH